MERLVPVDDIVLRLLTSCEPDGAQVRFQDARLMLSSHFC